MNQPDRNADLPGPINPQDYQEFGYLRESAEYVGLDPDQVKPAVERRFHAQDWGRLSLLAWGEGSPQLILLHGGAQNAHTWDSLSLAVDCPLWCVDLPGHGHSDWREDRDYLPRTNSVAVERLLDDGELKDLVVVGMSLGGLTALSLAARRPDLVRRLVLVDVTPSVSSRFQQMSTADRGATTLVAGDRQFTSFEAMLAAARVAAPTRQDSGLAIGVRHNSKQNPDGSWSWRYDELSMNRGAAGFEVLWNDLTAIPGPVLLVRGGESRFVSDEDAQAFLTSAADGQIAVVAGAGHAVQSDRPRELAALVRDFAAT